MMEDSNEKTDNPARVTVNARRHDRVTGEGNLKAHNHGENFNQVVREMLKEVRQKSGSLNIKIVSGSMSPLIEAGDVVRVSRFEPSEIRIGDIVAFRDGQRVIVHRIVEKIESNRQFSFRQRSDAGGTAEVIAPGSLIGRVVTVVKEGREISLDTARSRISGRILGWRGWLRDWLGRRQSQSISRIIRQSLKPIWRLTRKMLLWWL
jgi:signal peptidase I